MSEFKTEKKAFWAGEFGEDYTGRNEGQELLTSNLNFFSKASKSAEKYLPVLSLGLT